MDVRNSISCERESFVKTKKQNLKILKNSKGEVYVKIVGSRQKRGTTILICLLTILPARIFNNDQIDRVYHFFQFVMNI